MTDFLKGVGTTEVARDSLNMDVRYIFFVPLLPLDLTFSQ